MRKAENSPTGLFSEAFVYLFFFLLMYNDSWKFPDKIDPFKWRVWFGPLPSCITGTVPSVSAPPSRLHHHPSGRPRFPAEVTAALPLRAPAGPGSSDKNLEQRVNRLSPSDKSEGRSQYCCRDAKKSAIQTLFKSVRAAFFIVFAVRRSGKTDRCRRCIGLFSTPLCSSCGLI